MEKKGEEMFRALCLLGCACVDASFVASLVAFTGCRRASASRRAHTVASRRAHAVAIVEPFATLDAPLQWVAEHGALTTGLACYAAGLASSAVAEAVVARRTRRLTRAQRRAAWIEPWCAISSGVPPPDAADLRQRGHVRIGSAYGVDQCITFEDLSNRARKGECERSPTWSAMYETDVYIYKRRIRTR